MAQLVARLVRNEKVGGSNPPSSTTGRHPIRMSVFCMPGVVLRCRAARCARGRRPARSPSAPRASLGASSRSPARPRRRPRAPQPGTAATHRHRGRAPPPPTGTAAGPRHRPRAPQPGPAATHRHRGRALRTLRRRASKPSRALRSLRRPPHLWGRVAVRQLYASARCPARPCHCPLAPQPGPASGPRAHRCWAYTECRMQFPRDLFEP